MNESPSNFTIRAPTLEVYIPLQESLVPAPTMDDSILGYIYNYHIKFEI